MWPFSELKELKDLRVVHEKQARYNKNSICFHLNIDKSSRLDDRNRLNIEVRELSLRYRQVITEQAQLWRGPPVVQGDGARRASVSTTISNQ